MKITPILFILLASYLLILTQSLCKPLYTRIFYQPTPDPELKVDMIVMFNTLEQCQDNYIEVDYEKSHEEFSCKTNKIQIFRKGMPSLNQFVHYCDLELDSASAIDNFTYNVAAVQQKIYTQKYIIELATQQLPLVFVVTANLDFVNMTLYPTFSNAFHELITRRQQERNELKGQNHYRVNGIIINGGFAEGLTENYGSNFNLIMSLLGQFSSRWPLLLNIGPKQVTNKNDYALIQKCFVLGQLGNIQGRTGLQNYKFARKVNIVFFQTSQQFFSNGSIVGSFNDTLAALKDLLKNRVGGDQFTIAFSHYNLFCSAPGNQTSNYNCQNGAKKLAPLRDLLAANQQIGKTPIDLFVGAYQNNYQRNYPYINGHFATQEVSRYNRGDFISINQGTGGLGLLTEPIQIQTQNQVIQKFGKPGFGLLTIKGNAQLKTINQTTVISEQKNLREQVQKQQPMVVKKLKHQELDDNLLSNDLLKSEDVSQFDLFLLNYKHITIDKTNLLVQDMFRMVTQPQSSRPLVAHHRLRVSS